MANDEQLDRLRRRIRNLDAALLGLVAERLELAREVGREKRAAAVPLRDYEVEKRVLERSAESAEALPDTAVVDEPGEKKQPCGGRGRSASPPAAFSPY